MTTLTRSKLIKPKSLKKNDRVGLICPASRPHNPAVLNRCVHLVEEMGFKPVLGKHVLHTHGYMAGTDAERLEDLQQFVYDDSIAGMFCISGGYGALHLVADIDYGFLNKQPKVIVGSDDNTGWLLNVCAKSSLVAFHGPNLDSISSRYSFDRFREAVTINRVLPGLSSTDIADHPLPGNHYAPVSGTASGALMGGNLTALVSLMGTPYQVDLTDSILFLEDIGERNDILDRWFTTLYLSGQLAGVKAVAFGQFENCGSRGHGNMLSIEELFGDRLKQMHKPSYFGLPIGQGKTTATVPLGIHVQLDAAAGVLEFAESALA